MTPIDAYPPEVGGPIRIDFDGPIEVPDPANLPFDWQFNDTGDTPVAYITIGTTYLILDFGESQSAGDSLTIPDGAGAVFSASGGDVNPAVLYLPP